MAALDQHVLSEDTEDTEAGARWAGGGDGATQEEKALQRLTRDPGRGHGGQAGCGIHSGCDGRSVNGLSRRVAPSEQEWRPGDL